MSRPSVELPPVPVLQSTFERAKAADVPTTEAEKCAALNEVQFDDLWTGQLLKHGLRPM